jgi:glycerol-1-phosphate dehydrogenase [NAD(P)+]
MRLSLELPGIQLGEEFECECGRVHKVPIKEVLIARNAIEKIVKVLDKLSLGEPVCIVNDEITREIAGKRIMRLLEHACIKAINVVISGPFEKEVEDLRSVIVRNNCACILAVGGGSVIDVGKLSAYRTNVPFISIPTALSHDGIASATASLISMKNNVKSSFKACPPVAVIFDIDILEKAPRRMTVSGCGDLLSKATSLKDWELGKKERGEYYCPLSAKLALSTFHDTMSFIKSKDKSIMRLAPIMFKSSLSMVIVGSSRPNSGSEHLFSHYLDTHFRTYAMHGESVGLGTILMSRYHSKYNENWWSAEEFQSYTIKSTLELIGFPLSLSKLGISEKMAVEALCKGHTLRPERYTILHKRPLNDNEALSLLHETYVV